MLKTNILSIVCFLIVVGVFFSPTLSSGKLPIPSDTLVGLYHPWRDYYADQYPRGIPFKNFLITDPIRQQIPWRKQVVDEFKQGRLPLWNPYSFSGTPLLGNIQSGSLYPLNVIFFVFPFEQAWTMLIMLQPLMAGVFIYCYLRHLKLHPVACLMASISWAFSGFSIAWLTWGTMIHTALWLPLLLLCIDKVVETNHIRKTIVWTVIFFSSLTASFLAGHIQLFMYCVVLTALYSVYKYSTELKTITNLVKKVNLGVVLLGVMMFFFITQMQWRELFSLTAFSGRSTEENLMVKEGWFLPWSQLIQFAVPDFFGNPATLNYWGAWNYGELIGYIGIIPLFFVLYGLLQKDIKHQKFWVSILIATLIFILPTWIAKIPFILHLPILSTLQPSRFMVLVVFSLIMLSAFGFDSMLQNNKKVQIKPLLFFCGAFFGVLLFGTYLVTHVSDTETIRLHAEISKRNIVFPLLIFSVGGGLLYIFVNTRFRKIIPVVIILLISLDTIRFGQKFTPFTDQKYFFPETKIVAFLKEQQKPFRVLATDDRVLPPNVATYYGIEMISGYDPLYSKYYEAFVAAYNRGKDDLSKPYGFNRIVLPLLSQTSLLSLFNVHYVVSYGEMQRNDLEFIMNEGNTYLYKITSGYPRAFFVNNVIPVSTFEQSISQLFDPSFDVTKSAVVLGNYKPSSGLASERDTISIQTYLPSSIEINVSAQEDRFLVITNSYFSHWRAFLDNKETKIYQTNGAFQGVSIPNGTHQLKLIYEI